MVGAGEVGRGGGARRRLGLTGARPHGADLHLVSGGAACATVTHESATARAGTCGGVARSAPTAVVRAVLIATPATAVPSKTRTRAVSPARPVAIATVAGAREARTGRAPLGRGGAADLVHVPRHTDVAAVTGAVDRGPRLCRDLKGTCGVVGVYIYAEHSGEIELCHVWCHVCAIV